MRLTTLTLPYYIIIMGQLGPIQAMLLTRISIQTLSPVPLIQPPQIRVIAKVQVAMSPQSLRMIPAQILTVTLAHTPIPTMVPISVVMLVLIPRKKWIQRIGIKRLQRPLHVLKSETFVTMQQRLQNLLCLLKIQMTLRHICLPCTTPSNQMNTLLDSG